MTESNRIPEENPAAVEKKAVGDASRPSAWKKMRLIAKVVEVRLRFVVILVVVGLLVGYWDTLMNYWDKWTQPQSVAVRELAPGQEFYCPMDPQVVRSTYEPNGDVPKCPICGMPLSIRQKSKGSTLPEGVTARVQLSPERIQMAGIKTVAVEYRPVVRQLKTVGYVTYDESRRSRIVSRVQGYVEKLYVDKTFTMVHQGDPLAEIYSPELYSASQELILASQSKNIGTLAASAREKLLLYGVSPQEIDAMISSGQSAPRLVIRSPQTGYVIDKKIVAGAAVEAKMTLFEIADLSTVWVEAEVYENDIPYLRPGQTVEATVEAHPGRTFTGEVALVYPQLDAATRTNRVRFALDNPHQDLRPGMFATVKINAPLVPPVSAEHTSGDAAPVQLASTGDASDARPNEFLVVPERAVIDTGARQVVYVERQPGVFEGVEVELGPRQGDLYPVLKGLKPGDQVAAAGGFLIDAETRLNPAAASTYFGASGGPQSSERSQSAPMLQQAPHKHSPAEKAAPSSDGPEPSPKTAANAPTEEELQNIRQLPKADQPLAIAQHVCPITGLPLGEMGVPVKIMLRGRPVFLCCQGCVNSAENDPDGTLKKLANVAPADPGSDTPKSER